MAPFVNNRIKPSRCGCGEAVAYNVPCLAWHIKVTGINPVITDATIRHFITSKVIGCVERSIQFWSRTKSSRKNPSSKLTDGLNDEKSLCLAHNLARSKTCLRKELTCLLLLILFIMIFCSLVFWYNW